MKYPELYNEYSSALNEKTECRKQLDILKDGYLSIKTISGKKYAYLQYRVDGKLLSEYIKDDFLQDVRAQLETRKKLLGRIREIDIQLKKIETAAIILDNGFHRELNNLRRCSMMEDMPIEDRKKALAFSRAMTALEGIAVSKEIENNLSRWAAGDSSFHDSYRKTIFAYHLAEV